MKVDGELMICMATAYTNWRGEPGNQIVLACFAIALAINIFVGVSIIVAKTELKMAKCFLLKYFVSNIVVVANQMYNSGVHLTQDGMNCTHTLILYLTHQMGLLASTTSLLVMIAAFFCYLKQDQSVAPERRDWVFRRAVIVQVVIDAVGVVLICLPLIPNDFSIQGKTNLFYFGLGFDILANIVLVCICVAVQFHLCRAGTSGAVQTRNDASTMRKIFSLLKPTIWASAIPRILYIVLQFIPLGLSPTEKRDSMVARKWIGLSYYVSFVILPVLIAVKGEEIQKTIKAFAHKANQFYSTNDNVKHDSNGEAELGKDNVAMKSMENV